MQSFVERLKEHFSGEVKSDEATLEIFSHDASLFEIKPQLVVAPKNVEDIKNLVKAVNEYNESGEQKYSLTARSAGTDMSGGSLSESVIVSMTDHMNHVIKVGDDYAVAEPGVFYRDFERETLKHDLLMPSYPASREICAIGGMVANNSGGEKTLSYGKTEDYVKEVHVVLRDGNEYIFGPLSLTQLEEKKQLQTLEGELYRQMHLLITTNYDLIKKARPHVSKNSAGYYLWDVFDRDKEQFDFSKLIVGSQGTLGIITQITFRLVKPKRHSRLLVVFLKEFDRVGDLANHILAFKPESFESFDDHTFTVAMKFLPELVKQLKGGIFKLAFGFIPEVWAVLTGGVPKLVLLAEFTADTDEEAQAQALAAQASLTEFHIKTKVTKTAKDAQKYWVIRRESFNMLRHHVHGLRTAPFIDDIIVRPEQLPQFLPRLYEILGKYNLTYTIAGHVGDANFHIIPLMNLGDPKSQEIIAELSEKVYALVFEFKGSITGEHNDGLIRSPYLEHMYGSEVFELFKKTKEIFDPKGIFNPGKKIGATIAYAMSHLVRHS